MHRTDDQLVSAYVGQGDARAFQVLLERHQERVFGYLMGMVHDYDVANDLFQDTFFRVIAALRGGRGGYESQGKFGPWVLRIARNTALDHLRRRRMWVDSRSDGGPGEIEFELVPNAEPDGMQCVELAERSRWLDECIASLPPEQREVLLLRHEGELTFREIAQLTGCSINTALGRMRYALANLRRLMVERGAPDMAQTE